MKFSFASTLGTVALLSAVSLNAVACPSLNTAHQLFHAGNLAAATDALKCITAEEPRNFDAMRFLVDLYWWGGKTLQSEQLAKSIFATNLDLDDEALIHLAPIAKRWRLTASADSFWGNSTNYSSAGGEGNAMIEYRDEHKYNYGLGVDHLERVIAGSKFVDSNVEGEFVWKNGGSVYVESRASYSFTALFSPKWLFGVEPHYVFADETDVSIGYQNNSYTSQDTSLETLSWSRRIGDYLTPSIRIYGLMTSHLLLSGLASLRWSIVPKTYSNLFLAGGRTLEAPELEDSFYSWGFQVGHYFRSDFSVQLEFNYYDSTLRNENRLGLGFVYLF